MMATTKVDVTAGKSSSSKENKDGGHGDNSWINEGLQRHRRVVQELLQNHRESVQVQKTVLDRVEKQQQQNLYRNTHLLLTEGQSMWNDTALVMDKSIDNTANTGDGDDECVWSRESFIKNLYNYHDSDFILVPQDEYFESSEKQQEEYQKDYADADESSHSASSNSHVEASITTTKSSGESTQYHDCRYSDGYDDDSAEELSNDSLHSSTSDNESEDDKSYDRRQQDQHFDSPLEPTEEPPISSGTNEFDTGSTSSSSKRDHEGGLPQSPILSLSDLPTTTTTISNNTTMSSSEFIINEQNVTEDNEMQTSMLSDDDQNIFQEEQKKIEDILDSMNDTVHVSETTRITSMKDHTKDNTNAGPPVSEENSEQKRLSSEEQEAIDDILDGFFGEMDSLDDMEADKSKPFFPSPPPRPTARSGVGESDEDEKNSINEGSSRSDDSSNLKDSSHAESIESSSDDDDDDDDDEQSNYDDDQSSSSSSSSSSGDKSSTSSKSPSSPLPINSTGVYADDDIEDAENLANESEISGVKRELEQDETAVSRKSETDEIDDILDFFLDEMDSMDANDQTEQKDEKKKRPSFDAFQISDSSSEDTSEKSGPNQSRTNSMLSKNECPSSVDSSSSRSATLALSNKEPTIAIGGAKSVFTTAVAVSSAPTMGTLSSNVIATISSHDNSVSKSPRIEHPVLLPTGAQLKDLVSKKSDGAVSPFTPLYESKSRIATPDLNIQTDSNVVHPAVDKSEETSLDGVELDDAEKRPHDPVATALFKNSSDLKVEEPNAGEDGDDKDCAEVLTEDEGSTTENEILSPSLSPVPPSKPSNEGHLQASRPCSPSSDASPIPDFQIQSVSTMSGSPLSHLVGFDRVGIDSETPEHMTPVIEIDATPATVLPDLSEKDKGLSEDKLDPVNESKASAKDKEVPETRTPQIDPDIPFSRTNIRMERRKNEHTDKPTSPHKVETSRLPFQGLNLDETDDAGVSVAAFSTPGRASSVCSSIRGFHSLASPPKSYIPPTTTTPSSIRLVSRTPTDRKAIAKSKLVLCQKIAAPSYHHQSVRVCTNKFIYNLHPKLGPCDRCWALASRDEQERFLERGTHLRIARTRGGCDRTCTIFPPLRTSSLMSGDGTGMKGGKDCGGKLKEGSSEPPIRLCRQCFFATHQRDGSRISVYRGNHIKVKSTL